MLGSEKMREIKRKRAGKMSPQFVKVNIEKVYQRGKCSVCVDMFKGYKYRLNLTSFHVNFLWVTQYLTKMYEYLFALYQYSYTTAIFIALIIYLYVKY